MKIELEGFHGTSFENAKEIILKNFNLSIGNKEWLGDGVYFFTEGLSKTPSKQAEDWTIAQSWDNINKCQKYKRYSVIKCDIVVEDDNFLDLTSSDGIEVLNYIIEQHISKMKEIDRNIGYIDGFVINFARQENIIPIKAAKGNFYIKFTKERIGNINRRTSNSTICSVYNPEELIVNKELLLTKEIK